ncbi:hypothetical protein AB0F96_12435 [Streptomyces sp. NPDC023998]|uniref:hypothetical protein n=1 Tax=Streptomyces sp. NPDC023998 TaxID=3154597 RepID=UPI0033F39E19
MVDPLGVSKAAHSGYRMARFGARTFTERRFLREHLLAQAAITAIHNPAAELPDSTRQAARNFAEVLARTPVPLDDTDPRLMSRIKRRWQRLRLGARYPQHKGTARTTFDHRLYEWAKKAAASPQGREALRLAGFQGGDDPSTEFADRFQRATQMALLDAKPLSESENALRDQMMRETMVGLTDQQRMHRLRELKATTTAVVTGAAVTTYSMLASHNELWPESITFGTVAAGLVGVAYVTYGGFTTATLEMAAARRQVRAWLNRLTLSLQNSYRTDGQLPEPCDPDWLPKVLYEKTRRITVSSDGRPPRSDLDHFLAKEYLIHDVKELINTAERTRDTQLMSSLLDLETGINYDSRIVPFAVRALLDIVRNVPPLASESSPPQISQISPGGGKNELAQELPEREQP